MASRHQPVGRSAPQRALSGYDVEHAGADTPRLPRRSNDPIRPYAPSFRWLSGSGFESLLIQTIRFDPTPMSPMAPGVVAGLTCCRG